MKALAVAALLAIGVSAAALNADQAAWLAHDASALMAAQEVAPFPNGILIDQGMADKFLEEQLYPGVFEDACRAAGQPLELRRHAGYDHGYYFISSFIADHVAFHSRRLKEITS